MGQYRLMKAAQFELVLERSLEVLSQPVEGHSAHKIGAQLNGGLLGADDLKACFFGRLVGALGKESQRLVIAHFRAVHLVIEDGVGYSPEIEFELHQSQAQIAVAVPLVEHGLLDVNRPAFGENT